MTKLKSLLNCTLAISLLVLCGCDQTSSMLGGAALGTGAGAGIGHAIGGKRGSILGAVIGGLGGGAIGRQLGDKPQVKNQK